MSNYSEFILENPSLLLEISQGVEREGLRVDEKFNVSNQPHNKALGSKLTHPFITTDYAENLLEFITSVYSDDEELVKNLEEIHSFTLQNMDDNEFIWPWSMPSIVPLNEDDIPVAHYGSSNTGRLKELYRIGLGYRYGKSMQSIAGVHYNFSLGDKFWKAYADQNNISMQEAKNEGYFHLIRNYRRLSPVLIYLFGATPVVHESFLVNKKHKLEKLGKETFGKRFATSLRMGGLGYTSNAQEKISVCYNSLPTYIKTLENARLESYPAYEKIGLKEGDTFKQLNTNLLQIDNEFYSTIRPKNIARSGESALGALYDRGIEYIEVRLIDVDPFSNIGIDIQSIRFLHIFLCHCLFSESPKISKDECEEIDSNFSKIVNEGRNPSLELEVNGIKSSRDKFMQDIFEKLEGVASLLDSNYNDSRYSNALKIQKEKIKDSSLLPSNRVIQSISEEESIIDSMSKLSQKYKEELTKISYPNNWAEIAKMSLKDQIALESDDESFEDFLVRYFDQIKIKFRDSDA